MSGGEGDAKGWIGRRATHESRMAEMGVMSAELLHELKQPLVALKGFAQIARAEVDGTCAERLDRILDQVAYMESLIAHYGSFGRSDDADVVFPVAEPVRTAVEMLADTARRAGVEVRCTLGDATIRVRCRKAAIRQVVLNLLKNAIDAVRERRSAHVEVRVRRDGDRVAIEVQDSGAGIPESVRGRAFEAFVTSKPPGEGTGLGLFIVWQLVEEAGGTIAMENTPSGGTLVAIHLPSAA